LFKALLLAVWHDLSDVKLAEALDDRVSFRWFCGFSGAEARASIGRYLGWYNGGRPHSSLDRLTPDQAYFNNTPLLAAA
jgi:IS5 family transposase